MQQMVFLDSYYWMEYRTNSINGIKNEVVRDKLLRKSDANIFRKFNFDNGSKYIRNIRLKYAYFFNDHLNTTSVWFDSFNSNECIPIFKAFCFDCAVGPLRSLLNERMALLLVVCLLRPPELGKMAYQAATHKYQNLLTTFEEWKETTITADYE